jgi:hypothetical protein
MAPSSISKDVKRGLTGDVFNFFGGLSSIVIPIAIGYLVQSGRNDGIEIGMSLKNIRDGV